MNGKRYYIQIEAKKKKPAILILNKINFKTKTIIKCKEGHYIMIKESIQQEDITFINIYAPNLGAQNIKYIKQILFFYKANIKR